MALISSILNAYLTGCFLLEPDLRELQNYPIFLLTLTDFLVTTVGSLGLFFTRYFVVHHPSNYYKNFNSEGFTFFNKTRYQIQQLIQRWITENVSPFWFSCLPNFAMRRLNEYGFGLCSLLLAYDRYVSICKPTEKNTLLSSHRRKKLYSTATVIIFLSITIDAVHSYMRQQWNCGSALILDNNAHPIATFSMNALLSLLYSFIPAIFCFKMYWDIGWVLLSRDRKIGRNLNLVLSFATICCVWVLCLLSTFCWNLYVWIVDMTVYPKLKKLTYPLMLNSDQRSIIYQLSAISSLVNPFLILICQKDYRTPFKKQLKKIREKRKIFFGRS